MYTGKENVGYTSGYSPVYRAIFRPVIPAEYLEFSFVENLAFSSHICEALSGAGNSAENVVFSEEYSRRIPLLFISNFPQIFRVG
jgi:hypothetical protein